MVWQIKIDLHGYGSIGVYADGQQVRGRVHRVVYAHHHGLDMDDLRGLVVDHLCGVRACCNPNHLEAISQQENQARRGQAVTSCPAGHLYTSETLPKSRRKNCTLCRINKTHVPAFGHEFVADPTNPSSKRRRCLVCREGAAG